MEIISLPWVLVAVAVVTVYGVSFAGHRSPSLDHIPTIGFASFPTSFWTISRFVANYRQLIQEGCIKYKNKAFKVINPQRWVVVLSGDYLEDIRRATNHELSFVEASNDFLKFGHTSGLELELAHIPRHISVMRARLSQDFSEIYDDIRDEVVAAFDEMLGLKSTEWRSVPALTTVQNIICRASNRALVGKHLCRDPDWIDLNVHCPSDIIREAAILEFFPRFMFSLVSKCLSNAAARVRRGTKHLDLVIKERRKRIAEGLIGNGWYDIPNDYLQWIQDDRSDYDASHIIQRILSINFVINSTTASVFTQALYNLAANQEYIQPLREEVEAIVYQEGWTKDAFARMLKVDSFLKETMRLEGVSSTTIMRKAMKDFTLSDGTVIPTGTLLVVAMERIHRDATIYDNPEGFEPFRFTGVQDTGENIYVKQKMMAINRNWLGFGYGKHACPGRFFAAVLMKTMFAHIVLYYDIQLEDNCMRPPSVYMATGTGAHPTAKLTFRRRLPRIS